MKVGSTPNLRSISRAKRSFHNLFASLDINEPTGGIDYDQRIQEETRKYDILYQM